MCHTVIIKVVHGLSTGGARSSAFVLAMLLFALGIGWSREKFEGGILEKVMGSGFLSREHATVVEIEEPLLESHP